MNIQIICEQYNIINYTINSDGSIDVNGWVDLSEKGLTELPLSFNKVYGNFFCGDNKLTTLKGSPRWVDGSFYCSSNRLPSLEFCPDYVGSYFICRYNNLTDNYCESEIGGGFYTTVYQDGMIFDYNLVTNYNEWRKLYKRKMILNDIFNM